MLAICFAAVFYRDNSNLIAMLVEENAIITNSKPELRRIAAL